MSSRTTNMTQGNPTALILRFSLPLLAGNILQQLYNLVDTLVVGRAEGVTALAAVSSTGWLDWTLLGLIIGLSQGFAIHIAHCFGAEDQEGLRCAAGQSLMLAVLVVAALEILAQAALRGAVSTFTGQNFGAKKLDRVRLGLRKTVQLAVMMAVFIGAGVILWGKPLLRLFIQDDPAIVEEVLRYGYRYLVFMGAGLFALYLLFVFRSALQGLGDTVTSMFSGVLELFMRSGCALVLPLFMGEWGIYTAGVISWFGAAVLLAVSCNRRLKKLSSSI